MKNRRRHIYEGSGTNLIQGTEPGTFIQSFKDTGCFFDDRSPTSWSGKGAVNSRISECLLGGLHAIGIPNHLVRRESMCDLLIRQAEMIPVTVIIRNIAAGNFAKRYEIPLGATLPRSIVEYYLKNQARPMVTEEHLTAMGLANPHDLDDMMAMALRVNDFLSGWFLAVGMRLVDFKIEFGRLFDEHGESLTILADELDGDDLRLLDLTDPENIEAQATENPPLFIEGEAEGVRELAHRLGRMPVPAPSASSTSPLGETTANTLGSRPAVRPTARPPTGTVVGKAGKSGKSPGTSSGKTIGTKVLSPSPSAGNDDPFSDGPAAKEMAPEMMSKDRNATESASEPKSMPESEGQT